MEVSLSIINRHNRIAQRKLTPGRFVSLRKQADGRAFLPFPVSFRSSPERINRTLPEHSKAYFLTHPAFAASHQK
jgi:hypothetical protein